LFCVGPLVLFQTFHIPATELIATWIHFNTVEEESMKHPAPSDHILFPSVLLTKALLMVLNILIYINIHFYIPSGKKLGYKDKLLKKSLKNRVLKRQKRDEQKGRKNSVKTETDCGTQFENKPKPLKPIYNSEGKMVFSKFDFSESGFKSEVVEKGKEERDPHKILKKIEKQNEKLKELELKGEMEKLTEIREKMAWNKALNKSEGMKVKDNPELLKKTIKKEIKRKQKSKKQWDARIEGMKNRQEEKQKKRLDNIEARKKQVKVNKLRKAAKKGRIIPGF
jgi:hypothetical protein